MRLYFAIVASMAIAAAAWLFVRRLKVAVKGVRVTGYVVAHEVRVDDGSLCYLPVITFVDHCGMRRRFTSVAGNSRQCPPVDTALTVRFLPDNPNIAFVESFLHMWAAPLAMFVLGAAAFVGSLQG